MNATPTLTVPTAKTVAEDTSLNITGITVGDADAASNPIQVTVAVTNKGTVTIGTQTGVTVVGGVDGSSTVTLQGTITDLNNALTHLSYKGIQDYNGADTLTITVDDRGYFGTGGAKTNTNTVAITVTPVDDAPTLVMPPARRPLRRRRQPRFPASPLPTSTPTRRSTQSSRRRSPWITARCISTRPT